MLSLFFVVSGILIGGGVGPLGPPWLRLWTPPPRKGELKCLAGNQTKFLLYEVYQFGLTEQ